MVPRCHLGEKTNERVCIKHYPFLFSLTYSMPLKCTRLPSSQNRLIAQRKHLQSNNITDTTDSGCFFSPLVSALLCKLNILSILINIPLYIFLTCFLPDTLRIKNFVGSNYLSVLKGILNFLLAQNQDLLDHQCRRVIHDR